MGLLGPIRLFDESYAALYIIGCGLDEFGEGVFITLSRCALVDAVILEELSNDVHLGGGDAYGPKLPSVLL